MSNFGSNNVSGNYGYPSFQPQQSQSTGYGQPQGNNFAHDSYNSSNPPPYGQGGYNTSATSLQAGIAPSNAQSSWAIGTAQSLPGQTPVQAKAAVLEKLREYEIKIIVDGSEKVVDDDNVMMDAYLAMVQIALKVDSAIEVYLPGHGAVGKPRTVRNDDDAASALAALAMSGKSVLGEANRQAFNAFYDIKNRTVYDQKKLLLITLSAGSMSDHTKYVDTAKEAIRKATQRFGEKDVQRLKWATRLGLLLLDPDEGAVQANGLDVKKRGIFDKKRALDPGDIIDVNTKFDCEPVDRLWLLLAGCVLDGVDAMNDDNSRTLDVLGRVGDVASRLEHKYHKTFG